MRRFLVPISLIFSSGVAFAAESHLWDSLRPAIEFAEGFDVPVKFVVFLLSLFVFFISALAYYKSRSKRILLVSFAFFLFTLKWLIVLVDIFFSPGDFLSDSSSNIIELGILVSLCIALFYNTSRESSSKKGSGK